jgi:hypothetical protein
VFSYYRTRVKTGLCIQQKRPKFLWKRLLSCKRDLLTRHKSPNVLKVRALMILPMPPTCLRTVGTTTYLPVRTVGTTTYLPVGTVGTTTYLPVRTVGTTTYLPVRTVGTTAYLPVRTVGTTAYLPVRTAS